MIALNLAITHEFAPRVATAWAAVPGGVAIASVGGLFLRWQDLRHKHPHFGMLSAGELNGMGMAFHISLAPGVFVALAAAAAVVAAALVSRRPAMTPPTRA
ncbi:MAG: hypothetical protein ACRDP6_30645 [Actinoallomurus sp.]